MKLIFILTIIFAGGCQPISNSVWIVESVSKQIDGKKIEGSFALDYMINQELAGIKITIDKDSIKLEHRNGSLIEAKKIIAITENSIIGYNKEGKEAHLAYNLNKDKSKCTFILPDRSMLFAKKIK